MTPEDFGRYSYFTSLYMLLINIIPFGATMSLVISLYQLDNRAYSKLVRVALFNLMPLTFISLLIFSLTVFDKESVYPFVLATSAAASYCIVFSAYFRTSQKMFSYAMIYVSYAAVLALSLNLSYFIFQEIKVMYQVTTIIMWCFVVWCLLYTRSNSNLKLHFDFDYTQLKSSLSYGVPIVFSSLAMSFLVVGDKLVLASFVANEKLAEYSVAALVASTSLFLVNNFASAWGGMLSKELPKLAVVGVFDYYKKSKKYLMLVPIIFILLVSIQYCIYLFLYGDKYDEGMELLFYLSSGYMLYGISKYFMGFMNYYKKNYVVWFSSMISIVFILISYVLSEQEIADMAQSVSLGFLIQTLFCIGYCEVFFRRKSLSVS
jgi:O-antigen/teichoic acid export membrane protein